MGEAFVISFAYEAEIDIRSFYFYLWSFSSNLTIFLNPLKDFVESNLMWKCFFSQKNDKEQEEQKEERSEEDLNVPLSGPDTSSFSAFLVSLLSSEKDPDAERSESSSDFQTDGKQRKDVGSTSDPRSKERQGRRSLVSYSKRSVRKVMKQVARIGGYGNQNSEVKANSNMESDGHELKPVNSINDTVSKPRLPEISEPSVLLSDDIRSNLYVSLPSLVRERKWILLYR